MVFRTIKEYYNLVVTSGEDSLDDEQSELVHIITESGFTIVPIQTVIDALAKMEQYLREEAGITQEELEVYLQKIEDLVGKEECFKLELDDILSWIKAFQES